MEIKDSAYNKAKDLSDKLSILKINIENKLNYIKTQEIREKMIIINDLILNYSDIVNNQNNVYLFKISGEPFYFYLNLFIIIKNPIAINEN